MSRLNSISSTSSAIYDSGMAQANAGRAQAIATLVTGAWISESISSVADAIKHGNAIKMEIANRPSSENPKAIIRFPQVLRPEIIDLYSCDWALQLSKSPIDRDTIFKCLYFDSNEHYNGTQKNGRFGVNEAQVKESCIRFLEEVPLYEWTLAFQYTESNGMRYYRRILTASDVIEQPYNDKSILDVIPADSILIEISTKIESVLSDAMFNCLPMIKFDLEDMIKSSFNEFEQHLEDAYRGLDVDCVVNGLDSFSFQFDPEIYVLTFNH